MKNLFIFLLILSSSLVRACPVDENTLTTSEAVHVPINPMVKDQMSQQRFLEILSWFESQYSELIREKGATLKIISDWEETLANAFAQREGNVWIIRVLGGMARHHFVTEDAFILLLCHEMGHHVGGAPKSSTLFSTSWSSNEGQADYYASLKCMRKLLSSQDNMRIIQNTQVPTTVRSRCSTSFQDPQESALCVRSSLAALSLAKFFNRGAETHTPVAFDTPDLSRVRRTSHKHPEAQCRLDTLFAGSVCETKVSSDVSDEEEVSGSCHENLGNKIGLRPLCWFSPKQG